ncbi:unnamed protein product [Phytophthora fragariaefolia]|uniref:Unnamed protein product n=1 Tax=Phytophthora fragariaefolia TaxID=1490495 RepID=A0A9W6U3K2_9STRA|nr:unnamed protein product [Phytophthora fragariaefolia]
MSGVYAICGRRPVQLPENGVAQGVVDDEREACERQQQPPADEEDDEPRIYFEVERTSEQPDQFTPQKLWIKQADYEELWRDERMRSDILNEHYNGSDYEDRSSSDEDGGDASVVNHGAAP